MVRIGPLDKHIEWVLNQVATYNRSVGQHPVTKRYVFRQESMWFIDEQNPNMAHFLDGLRPLVVKSLQSAGYAIEFHMHPSPLKPAVPDLSWIAEENNQLRGGQVRILTKILQYERAQFKGITALGKTYLIQRLCRCFMNDPNARVVICTPGVGLVNDYYLSLLSYLGHDKRRLIGVSKGGSGLMTEKIVISTPQSLNKIPPENVSLLFFDEAHKAGAYDTVMSLTRFLWARMYGLSASIDGRTDGTNRAIEGLFGPIVEEVTYREAVAEGYVPDVETYFYRCPMTPMTTGGSAEKEQALIIHNTMRNCLIRDVCNYWDARFRKDDNGKEPQIIVIVDKAEHAAVLHRLLPEYEVIFKSMNKNPKDRLRAMGYLEDELAGMQEQTVLKRQQELSAGLIRKAIVISSMGTGVDTRCLDVVVRADGGKSPVSTTQYRGRVMRGTRGVYVDFMDTGERRFEGAAMARYRDALRIGMKVKCIDFATGREMTLLHRKIKSNGIVPEDCHSDGDLGGW